MVAVVITYFHCSTRCTRHTDIVKISLFLISYVSFHCLRTDSTHNIISYEIKALEQRSANYFQRRTSFLVGRFNGQLCACPRVGLEDHSLRNVGLEIFPSFKASILFTIFLLPLSYETNLSQCKTRSELENVI